MSSSRSIAAARNRRSGDSTPSAPPPRPNKSIGGQSAFVPQPQMNAQRRPTQQVQQTQQVSQVNTPITKLTVSDAIGLVTLRLGRLEQFMFDVQAGAVNTSTELPGNSQLFDKSVITSIVNRLELLEKREPGQTNANANANASAFSKLEKELKELKDLKEILLTHIMKYERFAIAHDKKIEEIDSILNDFENKIYPVEETGTLDQATSVEEDLNGEIVEYPNPNAILSTDLREVIKNELANSSL